MPTRERATVLFLCTHNSARSQMAEGLLDSLFGDRFEAYSAGTRASFVKEPAIKALAEVGIDISDHTSKTVDDLGGVDMDYVVTVCDSARENCPYVPGRIRTIHRSFQDPSEIGSTPEERLDAFRRTRDEMRDWIVDEFGAM